MNTQQAKFLRLLPFHFLLSTFHLLLKRFCLSLFFLTLFSVPAHAQFGSSMGMAFN